MSLWKSIHISEKVQKKNDQCKQGDRSDSNDNGYPQRGDTWVKVFVVTC